jgi:hemerythrin-like metal-binding protein
MALFTWNPEYVVGNGLIDAEHKTLFELADRLHCAMLSGQPKTVLSGLFVQLADYIRRHFSHEEMLMAKHDYPLLPDHSEMHRLLMMKLSKLQDDLNGGKVTVTMGTMEFLRDWLHHHIGKTDRLLANHVRKAQMTRSLSA